MHVRHNIEARSRNHFYRRKALLLLLLLLLLLYWVSVALVILYAVRMRRIILSSVACPALHYVSTLSHKRHDFRDVIEHKKSVCWFSLQLFFQSLLILRKIQRDIIINVLGVHVKHPLFLSGFDETWLFITGFRKKILKYQMLYCTTDGGSTVVKVLCYKPEGRWFDSRWCHWNISLT